MAAQIPGRPQTPVWVDAAVAAAYLAELSVAGAIEKLWGLEPGAAGTRYADDVGERISEMTQINITLGNRPAMMDAIFGR